MGKIIIYGTIASPPCRSVFMLLKELNLDYEYRPLNTLAGETRTEEFRKMNPQHTVPLIIDDGHYIWDSHAILAYLTRRYAKSDALYPKDFIQRAIVDQRLHFESGVLFVGLLKIFRDLTSTTEEKFAAVQENCDFLEAFLQGTYFAGDQLTIADLSIVTTVSGMDLIVPVVESGKWPKLTAWLERMKQLPYYDEVNAEGNQRLGDLVKTRLDQAAGS